MVTLLERDVTRILDNEGIDRSAVGTGSHPDTGDDCLRIAATIQQYSIVIVRLTQLLGWYDGALMSAISDQVRLEMDHDGETIFWLSGVELTS